MKLWVLNKLYVLRLFFEYINALAIYIYIYIYIYQSTHNHEKRTIKLISSFCIVIIVIYRIPPYPQFDDEYSCQCFSDYFNTSATFYTILQFSLWEKIWLRYTFLIVCLMLQKDSYKLISSFSRYYFSLSLSQILKF